MTQARPSPALRAAPDPDPPRCPENRISLSARIENGRKIIDLDGYIPSFLFRVNSGLSRVASRWYLDNFGVGLVEWRTIAALAMEPQIPARRVCELSGQDKAAASRSLHLLARLGHAENAPGVGDPRRKSWRLTATGQALHDRIIEDALERERRLIAGIDPEDLETFLQVMRTMRDNIETLDR